MPTVSVIVPAYGHADLILETLDSVFAQSFTDYEVIVVNDSSPDNTREFLGPLIESNRIRYYEKENGGVASARNFGISKATGEFIAFLDDDDYWPADKLQWQVDELRGDASVALVGGTFRTIAPVDWGDNFKDNWSEPDLEVFFGHHPFVSPGQFLIRKRVLDEVGNFDAGIWGADDLDLLMRIAARFVIRVKKRVALHYRVHAGNASGNSGRMRVNFLRAVEKNLVLVPDARRSAALDRAWKWLYLWNGKPALRNLGMYVRGRAVRSSFRQMTHVWPFIKAAVRIPELRRSLLQDLKSGYLQ